MEAGDFLRGLWHGGAWAYYWAILPSGRKQSRWFEADNPPAVPAAWAGAHVYMGVNTTAAAGNAGTRSLARPDPTKPDSPLVAALGCLFAEFDAKDFNGDKAAAFAHIERLWDNGSGLPYPSVVVDSGGGWHCYWQLARPFALDTDAARAQAIHAQAAWVELWGGDKGAKDIARVLRVPGTFNAKYDPPRPVRIVEDTGLLYDWPRLLGWLPAPAPAPARAAGEPVRVKSIGGARARAYGAAAVSGELARVRGATVGARNFTTNQSAYRLGRLVGGGVLEDGGLVDELTKAAVQAGMPEREARKEATNGLTDGRANPRTLPPPKAAEPTAQPEAHSSDNDNDGTPPADGEGDAPRSYHCTDLGNAKRLVALHGNDLRYCFPWAAWLAWNGRQWRRDDAGEAHRRAKHAVGAIYAEAAGAKSDERRKEVAKWAMRSEQRDRVAAMLDLARSEKPLPVLPEEFDRDPWLFNVENGTIDLRTGALRRHARADLLSKIAPVAYDPAAQCPRWLAFLARIMAGDHEMIGYLQRSIGYALTGDVSEQALFFWHGNGGNGKSTSLVTLLDMFGRDYATQAAPELLLAGSRHPTEVADLHGKRFVASIEVEDGRRLAEGLVKQMTGGDVLKARHMREDFFQFDPTFKLFLSANHKPVIKGTDYAIWRRIRLVPFTVQISDQEKDPRLPEKLKAELPGILAWAVRGCLAWQSEGLQAPAAVVAATAAYREESDLLGAFLGACTTAGETLRVQAKELYAAYVAWCEANGEKPQTGTRFGREMKARGVDWLQEARTARTFYVGFGLVRDDSAPTRG